jgi:hypothetical protein
MNTKFKYISFILTKNTGKTTQWSIHNNKTNALLGAIKWHSAWRSYCFFTIPETIFDKNCLNDIITFIVQLQTQRNIKEIKRKNTTKKKIKFRYPKGVYREPNTTQSTF